MGIPSFSRVEIRSDSPDDLRVAATALNDLADELRRIAIGVHDPKLLRLAAHDAIRAASGILRDKLSGA